MIHVEQKNILKKRVIRNLAKATNENSKSYKKTTTQAKKTSNVKEIRLPIKKNKATNVYCEFYYDFG